MAKIANRSMTNPGQEWSWSRGRITNLGQKWLCGGNRKIAWPENSSQADFVYSIFNRRLFDLSAIGIVNVVANDNLQLTVAEHLLALHFLIAYEGADGCRVLFSLEGDNDFAIGATCSIADYTSGNGEGVGLILLESDSSNEVVHILCNDIDRLAVG